MKASVVFGCLLAFGPAFASQTITNPATPRDGERVRTLFREGDGPGEVRQPTT